MDSGSNTVDIDFEQIKPDSYDPSEGYRVLEEDFARVIVELVQSDRLGHFANEFQRLMDALKESNLRERELSDKNRTLHQHIESTAYKYGEAVRQAQEDHETIEKLQKEVTKAWKMVDAAQTREQQVQETVDNLRLQTSRLTQEIETLRKMGSDQDQEAGALTKNKEALAREKERLLMEIQNSKEKYDNCIKYQEELEKKNESLELRLAEVTTNLEAQKSELAKERRFKEKLEEEMKELKNDLFTKDQELMHQTSQAAQCSKNLQKMEIQLREEKIALDRQIKESQEVQNALKLQKMEFEQITGNSERLQQELVSKCQEIKLKDEDLAKMKSELKKMAGLKDSLENKICMLKNDKTMLEMKKKDIQTKMLTLEKQTIEMSRTIGDNKKAIDVMNREKEMLTKTVQKQTMFAQDQQKQISLQEMNKTKLQDELQEHVENIIKMKGEITTMHNEKDRLVAESISLNSQIQNQLEELKLKEMELFDYKKRIANTDAKIKLQSAMFEQVRSERNQLTKTLAEANDEINELKHKLKIKSYQVQQLKEDIQTKDNLLVTEEFTIKKVMKEKEDVKVDLQKSLNELKEKKDEVVLLAQEENRLQKIIQDGDKDKLKLSKELNQVSNERDILGTQLVRRNDERALLYEKIKIMQSILEKGEAQYGQRVEDIRLLKIEIKKLRKEKAMLARTMDNVADLRQEIFHLERDFTKEKLKCRALEEELQNPLNVHRWRKLEGSDPTMFELIQKIQILQKRLLAASEEAIKRESQLKETERMYLNLKQLLARQPGPETYGKLKKCQNALVQRGVKMKCLVAELTMFENQLSGYKCAKERTDKEMYDLKRKFFQLKKREQKVKLREKELAQEKTFMPMLEPITGKPMKGRIMGAGFNVAPLPCVPRTPAVNA